MKVKNCKPGTLVTFKKTAPCARALPGLVAEPAGLRRVK